MNIVGVAGLVMGDTIATNVKIPKRLQETSAVVGVGSTMLCGAHVAIPLKKSTGACVRGAPCSQKSASIVAVALT